MTLQATYIGMIVKDLAAATAFYREQLGWNVDEAESIPGQYTQFNLAGGTIVSLQAQSQITNGQRFEPAIQVDDVDATYTQWQEAGAEMLCEPNDLPFGRNFLMQSPEGHVWRVFTPRHNS